MWNKTPLRLKRFFIGNLILIDMNTIKAVLPQGEIDKLKDSGVLEINGVEYIRRDVVLDILSKWREKLNEEKNTRPKEGEIKP